MSDRNGRAKENAKPCSNTRGCSTQVARSQGKYRLAHAHLYRSAVMRVIDKHSDRDANVDQARSVLLHAWVMQRAKTAAEYGSLGRHVWGLTCRTSHHTIHDDTHHTAHGTILCMPERSMCTCGENELIGVQQCKRCTSPSGQAVGSDSSMGRTSSTLGRPCSSCGLCTKLHGVPVPEGVNIHRGRGHVLAGHMAPNSKAAVREKGLDSSSFASGPGDTPSDECSNARYCRAGTHRPGLT